MALLWILFILPYPSLLYPGTEATLGRLSVDRVTCGHIIGPMGEIINLVPQTSDLRPAGFTGDSYVCTLPAPTTKTRCGDYHGTGLDPVRPINPGLGGEQFYVYCEVDGNEVIQRREELSLNFNRSWNEYLVGFGDLHGDHWLGLNKVLRILGGERVWFGIFVHFEDGEVLNATFRGSIFGNLSGSFFKFNGSSAFSTNKLEMRPSRKGRPFAAPGQAITNVSFRTAADDRYCAEACGGGWWYGGTNPCRNNINGVLNPDHRENCSPWTKVVTQTQMIIRPKLNRDD